jgi:alpha-methylacyl-CoA racemase
MVWQLRSGGFWNDARGTNWLDGGAHFYDTYRCADGRFIAVGAIEAKFYAALREGLGLAGDPDFDDQMNPAHWPGLKARMAAIIATRSRDEWCAVFAGSDACVSPVLDLGETPGHPHNAARGSFVEVVGGNVQPGPAPRFAATPAATPRPAPRPGADGEAILRELGCDGQAIAALQASGAVVLPGAEGKDTPVGMLGAHRRN